MQYNTYQIDTLNRLKTAVVETGSVAAACELINRSRQWVYSWLLPEDGKELRRLAAQARSIRAKNKSTQIAKQRAARRQSVKATPTHEAMKNPLLGDYLLLNGQLVQVVCETTSRMVGMKPVKPVCCSGCGVEVEEQIIWMIPTSPLFQQSAEPVQTMK